MEIRVENIENVTILRLRGALDANGKRALAVQILRSVEWDRNLILDLSEVNFISSEGILFLFALQDECRQKGIKLALTKPTDKVRDTLSRAGFMSGPLPIYASLIKLARGTEITLIPTCEGVTFNPERISFDWLEDFHRAEFRLKADASMANLAGNGTVTVYVGPVIVATLRLGMLFNEAEPGPGSAGSEETSTRMYRQDEIFMSYSHRDMDIVLNEAGFIRPVYWQEPIPEPPLELSDLHFDYMLFAVRE